MCIIVLDDDHSRKTTVEAIRHLEKKSEQEMALRRKEIEMRKLEEARRPHNPAGYQNAAR